VKVLARPIKEGLDYFPLNVVLNSKFEIIEARFGIKGFAVIVKLFQHIYGTKGYYCEWDEDVLFVFAKRITVGANSVSEILNTAIKKGIFDEEMYKKYSILTSKGIQQRYVEAKRGGYERICSKYLLISVPKTEENSSETGVNATKTEVNVTASTQRKENKTKENKIKPNQIKPNKTKESELFEKVWSVYPKKLKKQEALDEFCSLNVSAELADVMINSIKEQREQESWKIENGRYIPFLVNWLKNRRWEDEIIESCTMMPPKDSWNNFEQRIYTDEEIEERLRKKIV
jgi:hypothetical protein